MPRNNEDISLKKPIVKIILVDYKPEMQDEYSKDFFSPLIEGLLKRIHLTQVE